MVGRSTNSPVRAAVSRLLAAASVAAAVGPLPLMAQAAPARFQAHDIGTIRGGYAVIVADMNGDGLLDVLPNSVIVPELAWYENPTWERHVLVSEMPGLVNMAAADLDGDGVPELAFQSAFAMQAARSEGLNWIARHSGDPTEPWEAEMIDAYATSHHVGWADFDGDGRLELVNAPLIGPESLAPEYDQDEASIFWYDVDSWTRHVIADDVPGIIHRIRPVRWDEGDRDQLLVASFEGITLYRASGAGSSMRWQKDVVSAGHEGVAPRLGATDVGTGFSDGERIVASVEPWHGNEVVVYTRDGGSGPWHRRVIFDGVGRGHEVVVADLNGDGRADIAANDNGRVTDADPDATPGVHVFFSPSDPATGEWTYRRIEPEAAMNSCTAADIDADGRMDLVCNGSSGMIRWYENLGS